MPLSERLRSLIRQHLAVIRSLAGVRKWDALSGLGRSECYRRDVVG